MFSKKTPADKLTTAKTNMMTKHPFFAMLVFPMECIEAPWCPTMATDGTSIFYSPEWVDTLSTEELVGVMMHEVLHAAWLHPYRLKGRDHKLWNIACDVNINQTVLESGGKLPKDGIHGPKWDKYKGWIVDDIYNDLMKNAEKMEFKFPKGEQGEGEGEGDQSEGEGEGDGQQTWGGVITPKDANGKELSKAEAEAKMADMKVKVQQAAEGAKQRGKLPGSLSGLVKATAKPKINWQDYIQSWVKGVIPDDYTWRKPNRKMFVNHGIYMPQMQFNGAGVGVLSIDTSGSVSDKELCDFINEITGIIAMCKPEKLYIIQHDAVVQDVMEWNGEEFTSLQIKGRGGTCIAPVFKKIEELDEEINWFVGFSDMYIGDYPDQAPYYPVLWCATGPHKPPFGEYIPLRSAM